MSSIDPGAPVAGGGAVIDTGPPEDFMPTGEDLVPPPVTDVEPAGGTVPIFDDHDLILIGSVKQRLANPTFNRFRYRHRFNNAMKEWAAQPVFNVTEDQSALKKVEEDIVDFYFVRDSDTAAAVIRDRAQWLGLGSYRIELDLPAPEVRNNVELAKLFGVTHYGGLDRGGYFSREFKTTGITLDLDNLKTTLRAIRRVPAFVDQTVSTESPESPSPESSSPSESSPSSSPETTAIEFSGESFLEAIDYGLGSDTDPITFLRSIFLIPTDGYDLARTLFYLELVGTNISEAPVDWTIRPVVGGEGTEAVPFDLGDPQSVTLVADASGRVRSTTPFPADSPLMLYAIESPAVPVVNDSFCWRFRVAAVHDAARQIVSEIRLTNTSGGTLLDQTIGGGDIFRTSSTGLADAPDVGWVSVGGPRWKYNAADWATIGLIRFWAVIANASFDDDNKWSEFALWDLTDDVRLATTQATGCTLRPRPFTVDLDVDALQDGHVYEMRVRSVKSNDSFFDFDTYVHKGRLHIYIDPIIACELHNRCGNLAGVTEVRSIHAAGFDPVPDVYFEVQDAVETVARLKDYGTSDTSGSSTPASGGEVVVPDVLELSGRSDPLSLTDDHRFAAQDLLQGSLIYRVPSIVVPSGSPPDMSARAVYLAFLADQGFAPNRALLFTEGAGAPGEYYTSTPAGEGGAPEWKLHATYGYAGRLGTGDYYDLGASNAFLLTNKGTILLIRAKRDTFVRDSFAFCVSSFDDGARFGLHLPWGDGVVYLDYGGLTAPNRVSAAYAPVTDLEAWALRAGPSGMSIWKDGVELPGSSATAVTRNADGANFLINQGLFAVGDRQDFYIWIHVPDEVDDATLATFTVDNVLLGI